MKFKEYLAEGAPTGAQWEEIITLAYNHLLYGYDYRSKKLLKISNMNSFPANLKPYLSIGEQIAKEAISKLNKETLRHTGSGNAPTGKLWKEITNKSSDVPKTDMLTKNIKISLKKEGQSQLMSGLKNEALATFIAAFNSARYKDNLGNALLDLIENSFTERKDKFSMTGAEQADYVEMHREITNDLREFFKDNEKIKKWVVFEAMSGKVKFDGNWGTATHLMVFTPTGKLKIFKPISLPLANKLSKQVDVRISFKTQSGRRSSALRLGIKEENETIYDMIEKERQFLTEANVLSWLKNILNKIVKKVKSLLDKGFQYLMSFLGIDIDVNITTEINF